MPEVHRRTALERYRSMVKGVMANKVLVKKGFKRFRESTNTEGVSDSVLRDREMTFGSLTSGYEFLLKSISKELIFMERCFVFIENNASSLSILPEIKRLLTSCFEQRCELGMAQVGGIIDDIFNKMPKADSVMSHQSVFNLSIKMTDVTERISNIKVDISKGGGEDLKYAEGLLKLLNEAFSGARSEFGGLLAEISRLREKIEKQEAASARSQVKTPNFAKKAYAVLDYMLMCCFLGGYIMAFVFIGSHISGFIRRKQCENYIMGAFVLSFLSALLGVCFFNNEKEKVSKALLEHLKCKLEKNESALEREICSLFNNVIKKFSQMLSEEE